MLKSLSIKDYALIEESSVEFEDGLNIITGETGAGKSILLDALGLLLGERSTADVIRKGALKAIIEGTFLYTRDSLISAFLTDHDLDETDALILRREVLAKGTSRCFVNDSPVSVSVLKDIGNLLVDIHGQHEHQSLLRPETHISFLDEVGGYDTLLAEYRLRFNKLKDVTTKLATLKAEEASLRERHDYLMFQKQEIDRINPQEGEDESIAQELKILENAELILNYSEQIYSGLYESDTALLGSLTQLKSVLKNLAGIDAALSPVLEDFETAASLLKEVANSIRDYRNHTDLDPGRLEQLRQRTVQLNQIKKKYGGSLQSVIDLHNEINAEIQKAGSYDGNIAALSREIESVRMDSSAFAVKLLESRRKAGNEITKGIVESLKYLGIAAPRFEVQIALRELKHEDPMHLIIDGRPVGCDKNGVNTVEFLIAANAGEDLKPLVRVASGGEVSRIMLSLKSVLASQGRYPVMIFDEIDNGVSGRIAQKVGHTMKKLSAGHQIIAITHLPQIAGLADAHFVVAKTTSQNRVQSSIRKLSDQERLTEVAKLLSGETITESALQSAKELMNASTS